jgi:hypothetical protein
VRLAIRGSRACIAEGVRRMGGKLFLNDALIKEKIIWKFAKNFCI